MQNLRLILDIVRTGSMSRAAELHGITQSAASQRVAALEKRLGVTLLDRSTRPASLTPAGRAYAQGCADVIARLDALEERVRQVGAPQHEPVRLHAIYSAGIAWLNGLIEAYAQEQGLDSEHLVKVRYRRPDEIHASVVAGECDFGIVSYPDQWPGVTHKLLRRELMVAVCRPDHPLAVEAVAGPAPVSRVGRYPLLSIGRDLPMGRHVEMLLKHAGVTPRLADTFDNLDTLKSALVEAGGVAIMPQRVVRREVEAGQLAVIAMTPALHRPIGLIVRKGEARTDRPAVDDLMNYLLAHAADGEPVLLSGKTSGTPLLASGKPALRTGEDPMPRKTTLPRQSAPLPRQTVPLTRDVQAAPTSVVSVG